MDFFFERQLPTVVLSDAHDQDLRRQVLGRCVVDYVLKHAPGSVDYLVWLVRRLERNRRIGALVVGDRRRRMAPARHCWRCTGSR
jgi:hypothetical protein